ncbi:MAG: rhomboid family intramembrane serine protease [Sphingobacteriia bacterium]|nr:rhomboid family intramembrane serine protease [Sphingobacteriia bacterium]
MVITIILITAVVSFIAFSRHDLFDRLQFSAWSIYHDRQWYRFLTYSLLHADWGHLLINMFVLWSFGDLVMQFFTRDFGALASFHFLMLYAGGVVFATIWDFVRHRDNYYYRAVGASGAVAAVVFASIVMYPAGRIFIFFIPVGIPSWLFGILYLIYSAYMGRRGEDHIGHNAHFWGAVFGVIFTILINPVYLQQFLLQMNISN